MKFLDGKKMMGYLLCWTVTVFIVCWVPDGFSATLGGQDGSKNGSLPTDSANVGSQQVDHNKVNIDDVYKLLPRKKIDVVDRLADIYQVIEIHSGKGVNNSLLLADKGEGKTMTAKAIPYHLPPGWAMFELNLNNLFSETSFRGQEQTRVKELFRQLNAKVASGEYKHIMLMIDEAHGILDGLESVRDEFKKQMLEKSGVSQLWLSTPYDMDKHKAEIEILNDRLHPINLGKLTKNGKRNVVIQEFKAEGLIPEMSAVDLLIEKAGLVDADHGRGISKIISRTSSQMRGEGAARIGKVMDAISNLEIVINTFEASPGKLDSEQTIELQNLKREYLDLKDQLEQLKSENDGKSELQKVEGELAKERENLERARVEDGKEFLKIKHNIIPKLQARLIQLRGQSSEKQADQSNTVTKEKIAEVLSMLSNGRVTKEVLLKSEVERYKNIAKILDKTVVGHEKAKLIFQNAMMEQIEPMKDPEKHGLVPGIITDGPPGNGKSTLAEKAAAAAGVPYKYFNMSDFRGESGYTDAFGQKIGYVGEEKGGKIVNWIRNNPNGVIEFGELDRTSPEIRDTIEGIKETGKVPTSDPEKTVDATKTFFVASTNASAEYLIKRGQARIDYEKNYLIDVKGIMDIEEYEKKRRTQKGIDEIRLLVVKNKQLDKGFTPSLQSRFAGNNLPTEALTRSEALQVVKFEIKRFYMEYWTQKFRAEFTVDPEVYKQLVRLSYVPETGMRNLRSYMAQYLENPARNAKLDSAQMTRVHENKNINFSFDKKTGEFIFSTTNQRGQVEVLQKAAIDNYKEHMQAVKLDLIKERGEAQFERNNLKPEPTDVEFDKMVEDMQKLMPEDSQGSSKKGLGKSILSFLGLAKNPKAAAANSVDGSIRKKVSEGERRTRARNAAKKR